VVAAAAEHPSGELVTGSLSLCASRAGGKGVRASLAPFRSLIERYLALRNISRKCEKKMPGTIQVVTSSVRATSECHGPIWMETSMGKILPEEMSPMTEKKTRCSFDAAFKLQWSG
jgi:hypothetical protein